MATDANTVIQGLVTKAANFTGSAISITTPRRGMWVEVFYQNLYAASAGTTAVWSLDGSRDQGVTWATGIATSTAVTMPNGLANAASGNVYIYFEVSPVPSAGVAPPGYAPQIRLALTFTGSPVSPTVDYSGAVVNAKGQAR